MTSLTKPPDHYGLSLISGGAEVTLWDLAGMYTSMVSVLKNYNDKDGYYEPEPFQPLVWKADNMYAEKPVAESSQPVVRASSVYLTLAASGNTS